MKWFDAAIMLVPKKDECLNIRELHEINDGSHVQIPRFEYVSKM